MADTQKVGIANRAVDSAPKPATTCSLCKRVRVKYPNGYTQMRPPYAWESKNKEEEGCLLETQDPQCESLGVAAKATAEAEAIEAKRMKQWRATNARKKKEREKRYEKERKTTGDVRRIDHKKAEKIMRRMWNNPKIKTVAIAKECRVSANHLYKLARKFQLPPRPPKGEL